MMRESVVAPESDIHFIFEKLTCHWENDRKAVSTRLHVGARWLLMIIVVVSVAALWRIGSNGAKAVAPQSQSQPFAHNKSDQVKDANVRASARQTITASAEMPETVAAERPAVSPRGTDRTGRRRVSEGPVSQSRKHGEVAYGRAIEPTEGDDSSTPCESGSLNDQCIYRDVLAADQRLRAAYFVAEDRGLSRSYLDAIRKAWLQARSRSFADPDGTIEHYDQLSQELNAATRAQP